MDCGSAGLDCRPDRRVRALGQSPAPITYRNECRLWDESRAPIICLVRIRFSGRALASARKAAVTGRLTLVGRGLPERCDQPLTG